MKTELQRLTPADFRPRTKLLIWATHGTSRMSTSVAEVFILIQAGYSVLAVNIRTGLTYSRPQLIDLYQQLGGQLGGVTFEIEPLAK